MSINCQDNIGKQSHRIFWPTVSSGISDYTCFTDKLCLNFLRLPCNLVPNNIVKNTTEE